jgi:hypothetical protein
MRNAYIKWGTLCAIGIALLIFTVFCYLRQLYTWVMAGGFLGLFLTTASWKRLGLLRKAFAALKEGKSKMLVFYRDKNLIESQNEIIPAGADTFSFYGFLPEKQDIKAFRWQGIKRVLENEKELTKDDIMKSLD